MKISPLPFFLLIFLPFFLRAQENTTFQQIYLRDGNYIRGRVLADSIPGKVSVEMGGGSVIRLDSGLVRRIKSSRREFHVLPKGFQLLSKGAYFCVGYHYLLGRKQILYTTDEVVQWDKGIHFSAGYFFNEHIGLGVGMGLDHPGIYLAPVFVELKGYLTRSKVQTGAPIWIWEGASTKKGEGRRFPLVYSIQYGYSLSLEDFSNTSESIKTKGEAMVYPSLGLLVPTRRGATFQFDLGYKFQHYSQEIKYPFSTNYSRTDQFQLRRLALRAGYQF